MSEEKHSSSNEIKRKVEATLEKISVKIEEEITEELTPFLDGIRRSGAQSRSFRLFKEAYVHFEKKRDQALRILDTILPPQATISLDSIRDIIYMLFVYLGSVEGLGNSIVDVLVMLLVANGKDFHIECRGYRTPRIKHVVSVKKGPGKGTHSSRHEA